ncbi:hypothetical protein ACIBJC_15115 [Streptomyces sp. NPDC050509]|uniref:hypothetical protein n=1 Tax=Streptomyces sp. NPDC050509 TaxID=3365620 RepID=UPI0037953B2D
MSDIRIDPYEHVGLDEAMSADEIHEYDRHTEFVLDAQDEARDAAEQARQNAADGPDDDGECHAELIDGTWTNCGCQDCIDRAAEDEETDGDW